MSLFNKWTHTTNAFDAYMKWVTTVEDLFKPLEPTEDQLPGFTKWIETACARLSFEEWETNVKNLFHPLTPLEPENFEERVHTCIKSYINTVQIRDQTKGRCKSRVIYD